MRNKRVKCPQEKGKKDDNENNLTTVASNKPGIEVAGDKSYSQEASFPK